MAQAPQLDWLVHPAGFGLLAGWWVGALYCAAVCQCHPNIPPRHRHWYNLLVLVGGPWAWLILRLRYRYPVDVAAAEEYREKVEGGPLVRWYRRLFGAGAAPAAPDSGIELCTADGKPLKQVDPRFGRKGEDGTALQYAKRMLEQALDVRATDVLIDPRTADQYAVRMRIDGELEDIDLIDARLCGTVLNCLKIASGMDIAERRRAQDGSFMVKVHSVPINCRIATAGTLRGPKAALRILDRRIGLKPIAELGMTVRDRERLEQLLNRKSGMILVCGPTGSGKTTTLYSLLRQFDARGRNLVTIEDPIEYPLEQATQIEVNEKAGINFATSLRSMLRQNPDVIFIGEVRDPPTAELAVQAAATGHMVLTTVHGNDAVTAMLRLRDLGIPARRMGGTVSAVVAQRLVRLLCTECREPRRPSPEEMDMLRRAGQPARQVYEPQGCDRCRRTGYYGREGVFEMLFVTREIDELLDHEPSIATLREAALKAGMTSMLQHGMEKVAQGRTSFEEVMRTCQVE